MSCVSGSALLTKRVLIMCPSETSASTPRVKKFSSEDNTEGLSAGGLATSRSRLLREVLILLGFFAFTAVMTWPWVMHLRDAVADEGDPYMIAWTLWWD